MPLQLKQIIDLRPGSEPFELVEVNTRRDQAKVVLKVASWWNANEPRQEGILEINANALKEAEIYTNESSQKLQILSLSDTDSLLWNYGKFVHIYGKAPLPDPFQFFWDFSELLSKKFELPRPAQSYLSIKTSLREWEVMCYNRTFLMMTVPEPFIPELSDLFYTQAFEYTVLEDTSRNIKEGLKALRIGSSWLVAEDFIVKSEG